MKNQIEDMLHNLCKPTLKYTNLGTIFRLYLPAGEYLMLNVYIKRGDK